MYALNRGLLPPFSILRRIAPRRSGSISNTIKNPPTKRLLSSISNSHRSSMSSTAAAAGPAAAAPMRINPLPRSLYSETIVFSPSDFRREDESPDTEWYAQPRFVQHIDDGAIAALKTYYGSVIKPSDGVLDLCSSWVSHLPEGLRPQSMVGYGMNEEELRRNEHLTRYVVRDLNAEPSLKEIGDGELDVVICNVSVDYLVKPAQVFGELRRVLRVGGSAHVAFSDRCFPTKVIGMWMEMSDEERRRWVGSYFWGSPGWEGVEEVILKVGGGGLWSRVEDPLFVVRAVRAKSRDGSGG